MAKNRWCAALAQAGLVQPTRPSACRAQMHSDDAGGMLARAAQHFHLAAHHVAGELVPMGGDVCARTDADGRRYLLGLEHRCARCACAVSRARTASLPRAPLPPSTCTRTRAKKTCASRPATGCCAPSCCCACGLHACPPSARTASPTGLSDSLTKRCARVQLPSLLGLKHVCAVRRCTPSARWRLQSTWSPASFRSWQPRWTAARQTRAPCNSPPRLCGRPRRGTAPAQCRGSRRPPRRR
jgi:hypothetical protein